MTPGDVAGARQAVERADKKWYIYETQRTKTGEYKRSATETKKGDANEQKRFQRTH